MRLADILSKPFSSEYVQVDSFFENKRTSDGKHKEIDVGVVILNYNCKKCGDVRSFSSSDKLACIVSNNNLISIDCVLKCAGCDTKIEVWFLVESEESISFISPKVRIIKKTEKFCGEVMPLDVGSDDFSELLIKAEIAYREGLGAGSIIYLRKVYELITLRTAIASSIPTTTPKGKKRTFKDILEEVDEKSSIIPKEFTANRYKVFGALSDIIHGEFDEAVALEKYVHLRRLIVGVLENIRTNRELTEAIQILNLEGGGGHNDQTAAVV